MRRSLVALLAAATLALAGCGSNTATTSGSKLSANDVVLASQTTSATSAKVQTTATATIDGQKSTWSIDGSFDLSAHRGDFNITVPPVMGVNLGQIPARFVDNTVYVKTPANLQRAVNGKPWTKIDATTLSTLSGKPVDAIEQPLADPSQNLGVLQGATSSTVVGNEQVRGDNTTHYRVQVDLNAAAAKATGEQQQHLQALAKLYAGKPIPVDVWIDDQRRVRKVTYSVDSSQLDVNAVSTTTVAKSGSLDFAAEFYDFGTTVNVDAPAAADVMDASSLTGLLKGMH